MNLLDRFKSSLARSKSGFISKLDGLFSSSNLDESFFEQLEEILVTGDVGIETSLKLTDQLKSEAKNLKLKDGKQFKALLFEKVTQILTPSSSPELPDVKPQVILLVGVNGSGKTTSAAKLAYLHKAAGKKVLLVAGDTFRAAAVEQLEIWAERAGVEIIKQQSGSDPSALFFDAMNAARAREVDVVIGDTAGRLHNKYNLMEELNKIFRVINKNMPGAPHQVLLTVDATTGQNALNQAKTFNQSLPLNGLILTKLDGTARGGIVIGIREALDLPVSYIGTGECMEDLAPFDPELFARALLGE